MKQPHILLVEDEAHIAGGLIFNLECEGYRVSHAATGAAAMQSFKVGDCDLVILDLMLPDAHGISLCRRMRRKAPQLPILILTALGEEKDRVAGLAEGADDYLTKPFSLDEFLLRVRGMLRRLEWYRPGPGQIGLCSFGSNRVDLNNLEAETAHGPVRLTELEGRMLETFFDNPDQTLTRAHLLKTVWGLAADTETRTLDNFIVRLRRHFEADSAEPRHFLTVRGRGYRFVPEPDHDETDGSA